MAASGRKVPSGYAGGHGQDFWPYGVEANRVAIETLVGYSYEQGLAARRIAPEELFALVTLDPYSRTAVG